MISTILRLVVNVFIPAIAGYFITLSLVLSFGTSWFPALHPGAVAMIPITGLMTGLLCLAFYAARRVLARRTA